MWRWTPKRIKGATFKVEIILAKTDKEAEVISAMLLPSGKLYYFSQGQMGVLNTQYIENIGLNYHHLLLSQFTRIRSILYKCTNVSNG